MIDLRGAVRQSYLMSYDRTGCTVTATAAATCTLAIHLGVVPEACEVDDILRGSILGEDHPLMRLLDVPEYGSQIDDGNVPPDHPLLGM
jgi:hypothetical protein